MRVMLLGATGLVGQGVLHALLEAEDVGRVVMPLRRRSGVEAPKVEQHVMPDLAALHADHPAMQGLDACLDCIGVAPGFSEDAFRRVTLDLNLQLARAFAEANPGGVFAYVSGAGSDPSSAFMPLRVKGEAEHALQALPIATVMLRPGIVRPVDGVRSPHRLREAMYAVGGPLMGLGRQFAPSAFTSTRAIGRAMLAAIRMPGGGHRILENRDIERLGT